MARLVHDGLSEGVFKAENAKAVGNEKFQAGGFADALDWYDRSLKLIDDVLSTGADYERHAKYGGPELLRCHRKALKQARQLQVKVHCNRCKTLAKVGRFAEARAAAAAVRALDPENATAIKAGAHAAVDVMKRGHDVRRRLVSRCFGRERPPHVAGYGDHGVAGRNGLGGEQAAPPAPGAERCSYTVAASCLGCESTLHRTHLVVYCHPLGPTGGSYGGMRSSNVQSAFQALYSAFTSSSKGCRRRNTSSSGAATIG